MILQKVINISSLYTRKLHSVFSDINVIIIAFQKCVRLYGLLQFQAMFLLVILYTSSTEVHMRQFVLDTTVIDCVDLISPALPLFAYVFYHRICLDFIHYFLISLVQPSVCLINCISAAAILVSSFFLMVHALHP